MLLVKCIDELKSKYLLQATPIESMQIYIETNSYFHGILDDINESNTL